MFNNIDEFLKDGASLEHDASGEVSSRELQICTAALLLEVAYSDGVLDSAETEALFGALRDQFYLQGVKAGEIAEVGEYLAKDRSRWGSVTAAVTEHFSIEQKATIAQLLFGVMLADGVTARVEEVRIKQICSGLGLDEDQIAQARLVASSK